MVQLTYYPVRDERPAWDGRLPPRPHAPRQVEIRHGYTMADLDQAARIAMSRSIGPGLDYTDRYQAAWDGGVDHLLGADHPPDRQDLISAATRSLAGEWTAYRRRHGIADAGGVGPRFVAFWTVVDDPVTDKILDRMALVSVWRSLDQKDRDVIAAMGMLGTRTRAADALGMDRDYYNERLRNARRRALRMWFAPDAAPLRLLSDRSRHAGGPKATHCSKDHEWTPENTYWCRSRPGGAMRRICRACQKARYRATYQPRGSR